MAKMKAHQILPQFDSLKDIALYNNDVKNSLRQYFKNISLMANKPEHLLFLTEDEIKELLGRRLDETDARSSFVILTYIESLFQLHYLNFSKNRKRIPPKLLDEYKTIRNRKNAPPSLNDHIFGAWKKAFPEEARFFGELKEALKYRHWMAHGRYFTLKSINSDPDTVFVLEEKTLKLISVY